MLAKKSLQLLQSTVSKSGGGQRLDGKVAAAGIKADMKEELDAVRATPGNEAWTPGLAIVQVGDRPDSNVYIRHKIQDGAKIGIDARLHKLPPSTTQAQLIEYIQTLNRSEDVDGIIVQLPLETSEAICTDTVIDYILPFKDVDGLTRLNAGRLARGELGAETVVPCTPRGCLHLVQQTGTSLAGKRAVVLGRSKIVGGPAAALLTWHHATTTVCHSKTADLAAVCREADVLIVAIGQPELVRAEWIRPGAVVVDCGINVLEGQGKGGKNKLVGDVHYQGALTFSLSQFGNVTRSSPICQSPFEGSP